MRQIVRHGDTIYFSRQIIGTVDPDVTDQTRPCLG